MFDKVTIPIFIIAAIIYVVLRMANISNYQVISFLEGFLVGMAISIVCTWISRIFRKKKKEAPQEDKNEEELS